MKFLRNILKWFVIAVVLVLLVGSGGAYWFLTKSLAQTNGALQVKGLKAQVQIIRDKMDVPHIYASNQDDLFFAQGYVQAQDRLWQMDLFRHIGYGRTAELQGKSGVDNDKFLRTIGLARAARADWQVTTDDDRRGLNAFAAGVNAFIDSHRDNLPVEYALIGISPEPWSPVDSLVWAKVMAFDLGGNRSAELVRSQLIEKFGVGKTQELWLAYPSDGPFIIPPEAKSYASTSDSRQTEAPTLDRGNDSLGGVPIISLGKPNFESIARNDPPSQFGDGIGSNDWVIDGSKTTTGKPLLANDPHLSIQMPAIWYEIGLHCQPVSADCPYNVVGMTLPPDPGVVVGHDERIAWGVTNTNPDVQDYFIEKINPDNPNQYEYQGKWEDFQIAHEVIKVKGGADINLDVKISRHGPIMTPVLDGVTQPLALQWTAIREPSHILTAVAKLDRAQNFDDFRNALRLFDAPAQNFVYADVDGNIGYQMPGNVPIRAKGKGMVPVPGWTGEYEWTGYIPFDELPFVYNPPTHYIATANNAVVPTSYKYFITTDWTAPFRAMRINAMIQAKDKLSADDFAAIQSDVTSIPLARLKSALTGFTFTPDQFLPTRAMDFVKAWDGKLGTDSVGAAILEQTFRRVGQNAFANKMDKNLFDAYFNQGGVPRRALLTLLDNPNSDWWDDPTTPNLKETRDDELKTSYIQAVDDLGKQFGDDPGGWKWGRLHTATFAHPIGSVQPLNLIFNLGPFGVPGDGYTVFNTSFSDIGTYDEKTVPSFRMILDAGDWDRSLAIHTTGESGQASSKHYADMTQLWLNVKSAPLYWSRDQLTQNEEAVLTLAP